MIKIDNTKPLKSGDYGAERAGEGGWRVANKTATIISNRGGIGGGYIEEGSIVIRGKSNRDAYERALGR